MSELRDKVAVITGGASGVGLGIAKALASDGAQVVLSDVETAALERAERELEKLGSPVRSRVADVADAEAVQKLHDDVIAEFGRVDLLFNNAGVATYNRMIDTTSRDWQWVLSVNLMGVVHGINAFLPTMLKQETRSRIVNTASPAGLISRLPYQGPYAASKAAVISLSETLGAELEMMRAPVGVTVVLPGKVYSAINQCDRNNPYGEKQTFRSDEVREYRELIGREFEKDALSAEEFGVQVAEAIREERSFAVSHGGFFRAVVAQRNERVLEEAYGSSSQ
ncbi:MAG: SDR family NAD(P)-dependent oxidoreductase [Deltaproteobacteria bacterium]|nr:SDR family NAD(P)-dependent oxidoreductase [Deltaproteobacteria bacterium]